MYQKVLYGFFINNSLVLLILPALAVVGYDSNSPGAHFVTAVVLFLCLLHLAVMFFPKKLLVRHTLERIVGELRKNGVEMSASTTEEEYSQSPTWCRAQLFTQKTMRLFDVLFDIGTAACLMWLGHIVVGFLYLVTARAAMRNLTFSYSRAIHIIQSL